MITAVILGAGDRGNTYASFSHMEPNRFKIIGVADIDISKREKFVDSYNIPDENSFEKWEDLLTKVPADVAIITTPDKLHFEPVKLAMEKGFHILLEKPMSDNLKENAELNRLAEKYDKIIQVCHVLRYTDFYSKIHDLISQGKIGKVVNISMRENVGYYHYAHSYIRGNWHNRENSSPMILAKCSHDLDLMYWLVGVKPKIISSFGDQSFIPKDHNKYPERCTDGCEFSETCLYYAPNTYIDIIPLLHIQKKIGPIHERAMIKAMLNGNKVNKVGPLKSAIENYYGWPVSIVSTSPRIEDKMIALKTTDYGKCVYRMDDHNVVDHQIVSVMFENNVTATLTMQGFSHEEGRNIRVDGTQGTIIGEMYQTSHKLKCYDSLTQKETTHIDRKGSDGHGGGDEGIITAFINAVTEYKNNGRIAKEYILTGIQDSYISHVMAFAADRARIDEKVIKFDEFMKEVEN